MKTTPEINYSDFQDDGSYMAAYFILDQMRSDSAYRQANLMLSTCGILEDEPEAKEELYSLACELFDCEQDVQQLIGVIRKDNAQLTDLDDVRIRERPDLQKTGVVLIYTKTHRANEVAWETYEVDAYPVDTPPNDADSLVRTVELAGAVANSTILQQRVEVEPLETYLENSGLVTSGSVFDSLSFWWKKHAPELRAAGVTIKGFRNGERWKADGTALDESSPDKELVRGAITDWMEDELEIVTEEQLVQVDCVIEVVDQDNAAKKERLQRRLSVLIAATDASSRTYSRTESASSTAPEETPVGLAQAVHAAISQLHYDGEIVLTEDEASVNLLVGRTVNIIGGLTAWETMAALVQRARIDLDRGETKISVGPPKQLGPDDLVELYRSNRNRKAVTSAWTRSAGTSGRADMRAGLGLWHPVRAGGTATHNPPRVYNAVYSVAGVVPTAAELTAAIEGAYTGSNRPRSGDVINLMPASGVVKLRAIVSLTNPSLSGIFNISFTVDSVTHYAQIHQVGIY